MDIFKINLGLLRDLAGVEEHRTVKTNLGKLGTYSELLGTTITNFREKIFIKTFVSKYVCGKG